MVEYTLLLTTVGIMFITGLTAAGRVAIRAIYFDAGSAAPRDGLMLRLNAPGKMPAFSTESSPLSPGSGS